MQEQLPAHIRDLYERNYFSYYKHATETARLLIDQPRYEFKLESFAYALVKAKISELHSGASRK